MAGLMVQWLLARGRAVLLVALALLPLNATVPRAEAGDLSMAVKLSIPAQALESALRALANQADIQIMFSSSDVAGIKAPPVSGEMSARDALALMLKSTTLQIKVEGKDTVVVRRRKVDGTYTPAAKLEGGAKTRAVMLGQIVVTAQKYAQPAFDVPISMTVIGGPELQRLGITNLESLQFLVPGMLVENDGNTMRITIDGISNAFGQGALVGTYLDEADVTSEVSEGLDLDPYDLERVEVLKGPQGTLYGEGSLGGTIRYITNKPALDQFQMFADVAALFDQYGAPGERVEAVVNAPVIEGLLGMRIAAELDHEGGWIDQPASNLKNINGKNVADVKIEGRWEPRADLTIDAMEAIHRDTSGPLTGENPVGTYTQAFNLTTTPQLEDDFNISNVTLNWDPGPVTIVNSSTYFTHHIDERNFGASFPFTAPPSPRVESYAPSSPIADDSFSDEMRISGDGVGRWRWMLGGFYKHLDNDEPLLLNYFGLPGPPESPLPAPTPYFSFIHSKAKSLFGNTSYRIGSLTVGAGLRYFKDDEYALIEGDPQQENATFTSVDPRLYAQWALSRSVNVYASAAKGFRSGGFNGYGYPQFQPEHVWTYDVGAKMVLFDGRFSMNSDVFLSNYGAYQIIGILPPPDPQFSITGNAGQARIKGIESDVTWRPVGQWQLGISGDYIDARFVSIAALDSAFNVGDPLDLVPRYQITASTERDFLWHGRSGFARVDYTQRSRETFRARYIGPWYYSQSDYMYLLGFNAGINWKSNVEFGVFIQNLLNDRGYSGSDAVETYASREQPRTFGVDLKVKFE